MPVSRNGVYPAIDPTPHYQNQTYKGKVVFVSGASRGIGEETALAYARAGASLVLTARNQKTLDAVKDAILKEVPGAQILTVPMDVKSVKAVDAAMSAAIERFGKLDICIANAGTSGVWNKTFAEQDPDDWWDVMEVNIRGTFHVARAATPHLLKTKGYLVVMSSVAAQMLWPKGSAYGISKHALGRFVEFCALEHPEMKTFSVHPGGIKTQTSMLNPELEYNMLDTVQLPAATTLHMTSGKCDWLSGRYVSANWDLGELEQRWKDDIIKTKALVSKLAMPKL
ncbi:NAD-P-binding protein [Dentipellis sp. KUC8613]|nr:NAD-P-binding protein [Dentipellis sp. KUC8613]